MFFLSTAGVRKTSLQFESLPCTVKKGTNSSIFSGYPISVAQILREVSTTKSVQPTLFRIAADYCVRKYDDLADRRKICPCLEQ